MLKETIIYLILLRAAVIEEAQTKTYGPTERGL